MYILLNLRLPIDATLHSINYEDGVPNFFRTRSTDPAKRSLVVRVPDLDENLKVMDFMIGEKLTLRRGLLGIKIIQNVQDSSGRVGWNNQVSGLKKRIQESRSFLKSMWSGHSSIFTSNLCREVPLPGSPSEDIMRQYAHSHITERERLWARQILNRPVDAPEPRRQSIYHNLVQMLRADALMQVDPNTMEYRRRTYELMAAQDTGIRSTYYMRSRAPEVEEPTPAPQTSLRNTPRRVHGPQPRNRHW